MDDDSPIDNNELIDRFVVPITGNSDKQIYSGIFGLAEIVLSVFIKCFDSSVKSYVICSNVNNTTTEEIQSTLSTNTGTDNLWSTSSITINGTLSTKFAKTTEQFEVNTNSITAVLSASLGVLLTVATLFAFLFSCYYIRNKNKKKFQDKCKEDTYDSLAFKQKHLSPTARDMVIANADSSTPECSNDMESHYSQLYKVIEPNEDNKLYSSIDDDDDYDYASEYWTPSSVEEDLIAELMKLRINIIPSQDIRLVTAGNDYKYSGDNYLCACPCAPLTKHYLIHIISL